MSNHAFVYRITIKGRLDPHWSDWFEGMCIETNGAGNTTLSGSVPDQAALHGVLIKVRNLGVDLLYVEQVEEES